MTPTTRQLISSLRSPLCPACGDAKKPRNTFCGSCYLALPNNIRAALYRRVGEGYEEAFEAACTLLHVAQPEFPPEPTTADHPA